MAGVRVNCFNHLRLQIPDFNATVKRPDRYLIPF
jgi:hypothetical protein